MCHAFQRTAAARPDAVAIRSLGGAVSITWREYAARVRSIAAGLAGLGVRPGDTVGIMLTNRPEFHLVDTAILHAGATPFSIYNTNPADTIEYLFENAGNRVVVCEEQFVARLQEVQARGSKVEHIVCVDAAPAGTISLADVEAAPLEGFDFDAIWQAVRPEDLLTIVYTSGTTGMPKGVELTHANLIFNVDAVAAAGAAPQSGERVLSYLPDAHLANRYVCQYVSLMNGTEITTVANPREVLAGLLEVRPAVFMGVPQTWYKIKAGIEAALAAEQNPRRRQLAQWAIGAGTRKVRAEQAGRRVGMRLRVEHAVAERIVLSKVRAKLGLDQTRIPASGAAPISSETHEFMMAIGLPIRECWGMSELSAAATVHRADAIQVGTVGTAVPGVEIKLADDGELLVRGDLVMRGYRKDPAKTAETIDPDGWLHTGDIGTIDTDGTVRIIDRKKDLIINSSGKNMSPANIENTIRDACPMVGIAVAIADQRPFVTALLVLDPDTAAGYAARHGLADESPAALAAYPALRQEIQAGIDAANTKLSQVEKVRAFTIVSEYWLPGSDVLTPTMKVRRKPVIERYAAEIDAMYTR
jgi:long-subunit acyl-CoA synthetase (AMP-forming)